MGKRDEALALLNQGLDPVEISIRQGVSLRTILGYLNQMIGEEKLRRLDVLFSLSRERRTTPPNKDYHCILEMYGSSAHRLGDMYEVLRRVELELHERIRLALQDEYGKEESQWWRAGVHLALRQKLQSRREEDIDLADPYAYTDLLDLADILDRQWGRIGLKVIGEPFEKREILADLRRLNNVRRKVMHPVRTSPTNDNDFEEEFKFVCSFAQKLARLAIRPS